MMISMAASVCLVTSAVTFADVVVFDTFGPGDSYIVDDLAVIAGPASPSGNGVEYSIGVLFEPQSSGYLQRIEAAISSLSGTNAASFEMWDTRLVGDDLDLGFNLMGRWEVTDLLPEFGSSSTPTAFEAAGSGAWMEQGETYWLIARATGDTRFAWHSRHPIEEWGVETTLPSVEIIEGKAVYYGPVLTPAFRISVPAPGVLVVLPVGLVLGVRRRR